MSIIGATADQFNDPFIWETERDINCQPDELSTSGRPSSWQVYQRRRVILKPVPLDCSLMAAASRKFTLRNPQLHLRYSCICGLQLLTRTRTSLDRLAAHNWVLRNSKEQGPRQGTNWGARSMITHLRPASRSRARARSYRRPSCSARRTVGPPHVKPSAARSSAPRGWTRRWQPRRRTSLCRRVPSRGRCRRRWCSRRSRSCVPIQRACLRLRARVEHHADPVDLAGDWVVIHACSPGQAQRPS